MGKTTIEINGKQYDARSGALLGEASSGKTTTINTAIRHTTRVVDGFVKPSKINTHVQQANHKTIASQEKQETMQQKPGKAELRRSISEIKPAKGHKPQHAQTLMRKTVKKPSTSLKPAIKTQQTVEIAAAPKSAVAIPELKKSAHSVDELRMARAQSVGRSQQIKRFAQPGSQQTGIVQAQKPALAPTPRGSYQSTRSQYVSRPAAGRTQSQKPPQNSIFEAAIANARSHEQPMHKPSTKPSRRLAQIVAGFASVIVLAGFIGYMNMSAIELRVASVQAGFHAQLPNFKPTGYALTGGVHAENGIVSFKFQSGDSGFTVQQQSSNWDSQTLLDNVVAVASTSHKTYQNKGRTVYIYGSNATWVNGGVLYSMKVNADLSHQQIVDIAASM